MNSPRRTEIDVAKGFALFLVIFGHLVILKEPLFLWIFSFHMPAFFFLSGMTFKPEKYKTLRACAADKARHFLIPYLVITFIGAAICFLRPAYRAEAFHEAYPLSYHLTWIFYYGQPMQLYIGQVWYLMALFWAELFAFSWLKTMKNRPVFLQIGSLVLIAAAAVHIREIFPYLPVGNRLPLKLDTALCAFIFVIAGYYVRKYEVIEKARPFALLLIPAAILGSYLLGPKTGIYINLCDCFYTPARYFYPGAFCGIAALVLTASLCKNWRFWQYYGRYSMPIFAAHTFGIYLVLEVYERFTKTDWTPMISMPGDKFCLALAIVVFLALGALIYPWHRYKTWKNRL